MYQAEIEEFNKCILEGAKSFFTEEDGLKNLKMVVTAYESAKKTTWSKPKKEQKDAKENRVFSQAL